MAVKNKNKQYDIPGVYGNLKVKIVSRRTLRKYINKTRKDEIYNGLYLNADQLILIAAELHGPARVSTLLHEIHHSVLDSTEELGEEAICDTVGAYYNRLYKDNTWQKCLEELNK
jgi:Zn-dependent peptidase ImmA (M78 family)